MNSKIKKIPLPMAGLILSLASTGNLVSHYGYVYRYSFGTASAILLFLIIYKAACLPKSLVEGFENPVIASVMPTFSMGLMILSTYIKPFLPTAALGIWVLGLIIHTLLMICFTMKYILDFKIKKVFPSYFIVYVGIVSASVTAPAFGLANFGQYIFWFGFTAYLCLLPLILYRVLIVKEIEEPAIPTITILAAPASLCLAGYLNSFQEKSLIVIMFLGILSTVMLISVLAYMPKMLKLKFYPSYSAFTFPFIISAIAVRGLYDFLGKAGMNAALILYWAKFLEVWSVAMVIYVLINYIYFLTSDSKSVIPGRIKQTQSV